MYLHINTLMAIKEDEKKLKEYIELHNKVVAAEDDLHEFYTTYFDEYAHEGEYDDEDREELNSILLFAEEQLSAFEKKCKS